MQFTTKSIFSFFFMFLLVIGITAQTFTQKYRGYLDEDPVSFTLTFNRESGKIIGQYIKLKVSIKKQLVGEFYKEPKKNPKVTPTPPHPQYKPKIDTTDYFNLYEVDTKTKKKVRRATLVLGEEMHGTWAMSNTRGLIDLDLIREFDGKQETYQINEKTSFEETQKDEIAIVYPNLSGENQKGIRSFNDLIEQKIQATVLQFKQAGLKFKIEDAYWGTNLKWKLTAIFHTKYSNDRFISLFGRMSDNVLDSQSKPVTKTANFILNFDLRNQKEITFDDIFDTDSEHVQAFTQVCKETFRNVGWNRYSPNSQPISLQFCEPEAKNFNQWLIAEDAFIFTLRTIQTPRGEISEPKMKISFETIKRLGGKYKEDGVLSEVLEIYFRQQK